MAAVVIGLVALSIGVGFSVFSKSGDGALAASIPDPNVFNKPKTTNASASDLKHKEIATHILFVWSVPIGDKLDASVSAGPGTFSKFRRSRGRSGYGDP